MNFWTFLDRTLNRFPGWPGERQMIVYINVGLIGIMLNMAHNDAKLWDVEVFKVILQALALTGFLNMAMAFFFAANKSDEIKADNSGKFADAMKEQAITARVAVADGSAASVAADAVVEAAQDQADQIKGSSL